MSSPPRGAVEDCSTRSEADFPGAFDDPANLVVGSLALIGAGEATPAEIVQRVGGQKFPVLVREGHVVTLRVGEGDRAHAALGYGPLPQGEIDFRDGHETVTFVACEHGEASGSSSDGPVTFWSGFILVGRPACVPLDVYVDTRPEPRRVELELGRACQPRA
jgi:hypothetical protein